METYGLSKQELLAEYIRRNPHIIGGKGIDFKKFCTTPKGRLHVKQHDFLKDDARLKVLDGSRRGGKSMALAGMLVNEAKRNDKALVFYICFTATQAYEIIWEPLKETLSYFGIRFKENNTYKKIRLLDNDSVIQLGGIDKRRELQKYLGKKYNLIVIDECQLFTQSLFKDFLVSILGPAGWDVGNAPMVLSGVPNASCVGPFKDAVDGKGQFKSYKHFHWTVNDNPFIEEKTGRKPKEIVKEWADDHGLKLTDPKCRREAFGEWVRDEQSLIYDFDESKNIYFSLPNLPSQFQWSYVIGVDSGYTANDAIVVLCFCPDFTPKVFLVEEYVQSKSGWDILHKEINMRAKKYNPIAIVVDSAFGGKKFSHDLSVRYNLPVEDAEKTEKQAFIGLFNGDLRLGNYQVPPDALIIEDFSRSEWEWVGTIKKISNLFHSDLGDANLYAWRKCYHYLNQGDAQELTSYEKMLMDFKEARREMVENEIERDQMMKNYDNYLFGGDTL